MHLHGSIVAAVLGVVIIWVVLLDAFETVVLPRRVHAALQADGMVLPAYVDSMAENRWRASRRLRGSRIFWDTSGRCH